MFNRDGGCLDGFIVGGVLFEKVKIFNWRLLKFLFFGNIFFL